MITLRFFSWRFTTTISGGIKRRIDRGFFSGFHFVFLSTLLAQWLRTRRTFHNHYEWNTGNKKKNGILSTTNQRDVDKLSFYILHNKFPKWHDPKRPVETIRGVCTGCWHLHSKEIIQGRKEVRFCSGFEYQGWKRLDLRLGGIWVENFHLFVSLARFKRDHHDNSKYVGNNHAKKK